METADVILLIGANIADNHPILCQRLERNRMRGTPTQPATTVIVVDPRVTKTAMMADMHLPVKPRSDIALLNGIAHVLIREGLIDRAYIEAHTTGFEEFSAFVAAFTPRARRRNYRAFGHTTSFDTASPIWQCQGSLHRLDHGRQPLYAGRGHRDRHQ